MITIMNQLQFRITNLTCEACIKMCTLLLKRLPGVTNVSIDLSTGLSRVEGMNNLSFEEAHAILASRKYLAEAV